MGKLSLFLAVLFALYLIVDGYRFTREDRLNALEVPSGSRISHESDDTFTVHHPNGKRVVHPKTPNTKRNAIPVNREERSTSTTYSSGWVASFWTSDSLSNNFTAFSCYWIVPPIPTSYDDQILFLFNSFENYNESEIIQPVLDFNRFNTKEWSIASWYGFGSSSSNYVYSTPQVVQPGSVIYGYIYLSTSGWVIETSVNYGAPTWVTAPFSTIAHQQTTAQLVLEVYDIAQCTDYPATEYITFNYLELVNGNSYTYPSWTTSTSADSCAQAAIFFGANAKISGYNYVNAAPTIEWET